MTQSLAAIRLAMMARFDDISGINVPQDPIPLQIPDKTIIIFPRMGPTEKIGRGQNRSLSFQAQKSISVEYHRRISYQKIGDVLADVTEMVDTIEQMAWGELAQGGSKFGGTLEDIESVNLMHFGSLGWNEWTFGARMEISVTYLGDTNPT